MTWALLLLLAGLISTQVAGDVEASGAEVEDVVTNDETCVGGPGQVCSGISGTTDLGWRSFQHLPSEYDLGKAIQCGKLNDQNYPSDNIVDFCTATSFGYADCNLSRTDISLDHRKECLYRCVFGTPDLNIYKIHNPEARENDIIVLMAPISAVGYAKTPFLDNRSLSYSLSQCKFQVKFDQVKLLAEYGSKERGVVAGKRVNFIFHLGHTGSTLLARALGEIDGTFVLKEPPLLRQIAIGRAEATNTKISRLWNSVMLPWLSRRHNYADTVIVKASSVSLHLMRTALKSHASTKVVFMYSSLKTHLTICHARPADLFPEELYEGLDVKDKVFSVFSMEDLTFGQKLALAWVKRMQYVAKLPQANVLYVNMTDFLADPAKLLLDIGKFYGLKVERETTDAIAESGLFQTYSKDASVPWNATTQQTMMESRKTAYADSIKQGMQFARKLIKKYPTLKGLKPYLKG